MAALSICIFRMGLVSQSNSWRRFWRMYEDMARGFREVGARATAVGEVDLVPTDVDVLFLTLADYRQNRDQIDRSPASLAMQVTLPFAQFGVKGEHESISEEDVVDLQKLGSRLSFVWHNCRAEITRDFFESRRLRYLSIPMGTDARRFLPLHPTEHAVRDVAFVGGGQHRPHERRMLATVLNELGPQRVEVVGHGWEALGIPARQVGYGSEVNRIYNAARICVNLHAPEQKLGPFRFVNNRVFDIAAAGRLQISDYPEGISEHFSADELSGVADEDWADRVLEAVSIHPDDLDRIAARAREAVITKHTWRHRALAALEGLESAP